MGFSNLPVDNGIFILPVQGGFILKYHEYSFVPEFEPTKPPGAYPQKVGNINGGNPEKADKSGKINAFMEHTVVCESLEKLTQLVSEIMMAKKLVASKLGQELFGNSMASEPGMDSKTEAMSPTQPSPSGMSL